MALSKSEKAENRKKFLALPGVKEKLDEVAKNHGFNVKDLIDTIEFETAGTFDPSQKSASSNGVGLIQFMPKTIVSLDASLDSNAVANMTVLEQLDLANDYFESQPDSVYANNPHPYLVVASPKLATMGNNEILYKAGSEEADANPSWQDENGNITPNSVLKGTGMNVSQEEPKSEPKSKPKLSFPEEYQEAKDRIEFLEGFYKGTRMPSVFRSEINRKKKLITKIENDAVLKKANDAQEYQKAVERINFLNQQYNANDMPKMFVDEIKENQEFISEIEKEYDLSQKMGPGVLEQSIIDRQVEQINKKNEGDAASLIERLEEAGEPDFSDETEPDEETQTVTPTTTATPKNIITDPVVGNIDGDADDMSNGMSTDEAKPKPKNKFGKVIDAIGGVDTVVSALVGAKALRDLKKVSEDENIPEIPDLSETYKAELYQQQQVSKMGLTPEEEAQARKSISDSYELGRENALRGTAGDRAKFLAMSGVLDAKRQSALLQFAQLDADARRKNKAQYMDTLKFQEKFDAGRKAQMRNEEMQKLNNQYSTTAGLAGEAIKYAMDSLNNAKADRLQNQYMQTLIKDAGGTPDEGFNLIDSVSNLFSNKKEE